MSKGKLLCGWQEILINGVPSYARQLRLSIAQSRAWQFQRVAVLADESRIRIYQPVAKLTDFIPRRELLLVEIMSTEVSTGKLLELFEPASATMALVCLDHCRTLAQKEQQAWHFIVTPRQEIVIGRDFSFRHNWRRLNSIAVVVHRNGVGLHSRPLNDELPPEQATCFKFLPVGATLSNDLSKLFPRHEAGEIAAVHRLNRDELLNCLDGGGVNGRR